VFTPVLKLEHADARGEIYSITLPGDQELMLLHSKTGSLRGGHAHDVSETVVMLTGKMRYYKKTSIGEYDLDLNPGACSFNPAMEPHMGEFLEDSWLIEWKINTSKGQWRNIDDPELRAKVVANAAS